MHDGISKNNSIEVSGNGVTDVHDEVGLPKEYTLSQNYPNPFNPTTLIKYQLPQASKVDIKIYNIYGQEMKKLVDDVKDAGYYDVIWSSDNNFGNQVASGVYFYKLTAGVFTSVKKMLLLR